MMKLKQLLLVLSSITILFFGTAIMTGCSSCTDFTKTMSPMSITGAVTKAIAAAEVQEVATLEEKKNLEKATLIQLVKTLNEKIPKGTVISKSNTDRIIKLMRYFIEGAGYSKSEYTLKWWVCRNNHFHTLLKIIPKYLDAVIIVDGRYDYNNKNNEI